MIKKIVSLMLIFAFVLNLGVVSFAEGLDYEDAKARILELSQDFSVDKDGYMVIDADKINEKANKMGLPVVVPEAIIDGVAQINKHMQENNLMMNEDGFIYSRDKGIEATIAENPNIVIVPKDVMYPLVEGTFDLGGNIYRTYYDADTTEAMIETLETCAKIGPLLFFIPIGWFVTAVLAIAAIGFSDLHDDIDEMYVQSGYNGVWNQFWKYNTSESLWGAWYQGALCPNDWDQVS